MSLDDQNRQHNNVFSAFHPGNYKTRIPWNYNNKTMAQVLSNHHLTTLQRIRLLPKDSLVVERSISFTIFTRRRFELPD